MSDAVIPVSLWRSFSRGRRETHTWRSFVDTFVANPEVVRDKKKVAGYSLASFEENRRSLPRVRAVHALVLDFDEGDTTIKQAAKLLPGTAGVAYTTFRHTPEHPKLRVIFRLDRPVDADEYSRLWIWVAEKIKKTKRVLDEGTRDASRFWYLPSHPPGATYEWRELKGAPIDVARGLAETTAHARPFPGPGQVAKRSLAGPSPGRGRACAFDSADETFFGRAFTHAGLSFDLLENGALSVVCPWASEHTSGFDGDSSTVIHPSTTVSSWGAFHCSHAHCVHRRGSDLLDVLPAQALEAARREHGRGLLRARVIDGWAQRLEPAPDVPALNRFILKCRPREGAIFTMTVKCGSSVHREYLDYLPLPLLISRRVEVSLEGRAVRAARLVEDAFDLKKSRARKSAILSAALPGISFTGNDFDFLLALLHGHDRVEDLVGPGVRRIRASSSKKRFEIVRIDGSCVEF